MSKNVVIKKNGVSTTFNNVSRIKVDSPGGGSEEWYPEDECALGTLTATQNGFYNSSDTEVYGFNKVIVNVPEGNYTTGKGEDGKLYQVSVENGEIVMTEIPYKILVSTPPTQVAYTDGEAIDYTGMVVTLYKDDDTVFTNTDFPDGIVPTASIVTETEYASAGTTTIPVYWINTYTTDVMTATFEITVTGG